VRGRRLLAVDLAARQRRQAGEVEQVLHCKGHAGERAAGRSGGQRGIDRGGACQRALARDGGEAVVAVVDRVDTRQRRAHRGRGGELAVAYALGKRGGAEGVQIGHGVGARSVRA